MGLFEWIAGNWFDLFQTFGIVGGFLFTASSLRIDAKVRQVQNLLRITEHHRSLWSRLLENPDLNRVTDPNPDLEKDPITPQERLFVLFVVLHLNAVFNAMRHGMFAAPGRIREDIRQFFAKPIPRFLWQQIKDLQDYDFVSYVERALG